MCLIQFRIFKIAQANSIIGSQRKYSKSEKIRIKGYYGRDGTKGKSNMKIIC